MNIEHQFSNAARAAGIFLTGPITADGTLHRCHIEGHRTGTKAGAYICHPDGRAAGWALDYKTGTSFTWRADGQRAKLSPADRAAIEAERKRREIERRDAQRTAAEKARYIWNQSKPITKTEEHDYLTKKRIQPHGARLSVYGGRRSLVIPIINAKGCLTSLQFIDEGGEKRFLPGGEIKGCFVGIGMTGVIPDGGRILLCEGFATGASLHEWYGVPVVVAFNAGNLEPVAKAIRSLYPAADIIVCGDCDESGVGQKAARAAALAVGGKYLLPPVVGTDFNDVVSAWCAAQGAAA